MALPSGFFGSISRINTLGEGLRAANDVIKAAGVLRGFLRPSITFRQTFENRFQAALELQQKLKKLVSDGWPLDGKLEFSTQPITALWIELDSAQQTRGYVSENISFYKELAHSASIVLPKIGLGAADILQKLLVPVIIIVGIALVAWFAFKKKVVG